MYKLDSRVAVINGSVSSYTILSLSVYCVCMCACVCVGGGHCQYYEERASVRHERERNEEKELEGTSVDQWGRVSSVLFLNYR